jgi:hypothetical protein
MDGPSRQRTMMMLRKCLDAVIHVNRCLAVREVSEDVGITVISSHTILTEKLKVHRVASKFVPRLLLDNQKANRVIVSRSCLIVQILTKTFCKML